MKITHMETSNKQYTYSFGMTSCFFTCFVTSLILHLQVNPVYLLLQTITHMSKKNCTPFLYTKYRMFNNFDIFKRSTET